MEVFTHGLAVRPFSTALRASRPAASITDGFDVLVQLVTDAIATAPWKSSNSLPFESTTWCRAWPSALYAGASDAGNDSSSASSTPASSGTYAGRSRSNCCLARDSSIRSCGRFGPAIDGTTVDRSSSRYSENTGSRDGSCHSPCSLAYASTSATCASERPVRRR